MAQYWIHTRPIVRQPRLVGGQKWWPGNVRRPRSKSGKWSVMESLPSTNWIHQWMLLGVLNFFPSYQVVGVSNWNGFQCFYFGHFFVVTHGNSLKTTDQTQVIFRLIAIGDPHLWMNHNRSPILPQKVGIKFIKHIRLDTGVALGIPYDCTCLLILGFKVLGFRLDSE